MEPNANQPNFETTPLTDQPVPPVHEPTASPVSQPPSLPTMISSPGSIYGPSPAPPNTLDPTPEPGLASSNVDSVEPRSTEPATAPEVANPSGYAVSASSNQTLVPESASLAPLLGAVVAGDMSAPAGQMVTPQVTAEAIASPSVALPKSRRLSNKALIAVAGVILLALGFGGYYFGYYTNSSVVYSQSLSNAGEAYDKLVTYLDVQTKVGNKGYSGDGSYKIVSGDTTTDGKLSVKTDGNNSDTNFDVGLGVTRVSVEARTIKQAASVTPDIYVKATGLKGVGGLTGSPQFGAALDQLEGKWIVVDHTLIDNLAKSAAQTGSGMTAPTRDQVVDELHAFGKVNQQYIFSTKKDKAVTTVVKTYGVETVEGHKVIHYKVAFVKDNVKKYIVAQRDALNSSQLGNWIKKNNYKASVDSSYARLVKSADAIKSSDTIDVWSDINTRVLYKVRVSDKKNSATNYVDLGLDYKNSASYPFFISSQSQDGTTSSNGSLVATLDTITSSLTLKATFKQSGSSPSTTNATFTFKPSNDTLKIAVPTGAEPLSQVLGELGLGDPLSSLNNINTGSTDSRRQTDLQSLQTQAEAFFSQKGYYPSLMQFNSATWRKTNMSSLDATALKDPDGSAVGLLGVPAVHTYAYQAKAANGASCDGIGSTACASYTLTATLRDGTAYTKASLN